MSYYYIDIETTGLDEVKDKIITIQWAKLDSLTGKINGDIHILKEWESSQREIIEKFALQVPVFGKPFDFVAVGYNLNFEHKFLLEKSSGQFPILILSHPFIDLHSVVILINNDQFKDS